jgi:hypothetical protein
LYACDRPISHVTDVVFQGPSELSASATAATWNIARSLAVRYIAK